MSRDKLEENRKMVRSITLSIMDLVKQRMDLVKQIGEIKQRLGLDVIDKHAEDELRENVIEFSKSKGLDTNFALRLLSILVDESRKIQSKSIKNGVTPTQIFTKAKELEEQGRKIIHLEVGEPDLDPPNIVKEAVIEAIDKKRYRYTEPAGIRELRDAIKKHLNLEHNNIMITPGGRFGIYLAISLLNEGEEVIVIDPSWPAYKDCAKLANVNTRVIRTDLDNNWNVDIEELHNAINDNTKMLILNYPNNPTGKILDDNTIRSIVEIAKDNNLLILSDEVYSYYSFKEFTSIKDYDVDYILISSFSKAYSMTGFRVGFAASNNPNIIKRMVKHQAVALTSVAEPMQYAALKALNEDHHIYAKIMRERLAFLAKRLEDMNLSFYKPDGGMYIFARVNKDGFDAQEFAYKMLEEGLAITPGTAFGDYKNYLRISACNDINVLEEGLNILERFVR
ncbi:MAG: aminotransferase [Candidatus Nitrosocaldaceae archaeon]|nr:MAG: aminotransferase [Candidatus Nitrosocaldaceae archaeon]